MNRPFCRVFQPRDLAHRMRYSASNNFPQLSTSCVTFITHCKSATSITHIRTYLIAVHVYQQVHAVLVHQRTGVVHLGAVRQRRLRPLPVQVPAAGVHPQMTTGAAVWVHVGHGVEHGVLKQVARDAIVAVGQALQQACKEMVGKGRKAAPLQLKTYAMLG